MIAEGVALLDKALRHAQPGPYQIQAAIAALHAQAKTPAETDWKQIELLYANLERLQPSPVVTLNRAVAASKVRGAAGRARDDRAARERARRLFPLSRGEGRVAHAAEASRRSAGCVQPGDRASRNSAAKPRISANSSTGSTDSRSALSFEAQQGCAPKTLGFEASRPTRSRAVSRGCRARCSAGGAPDCAHDRRCARATSERTPLRA